MDDKEINILECPRIFIYEKDKKYPYLCQYTSKGFPYYVPPKDKYIQQGSDIMAEYIFLPITPEEFINNRKSLFYGYRIIVIINSPSVVGFIHAPELNTVMVDIDYSVSRIRYYPMGERSIRIDKENDPLFPPQRMNVRSDNIECDTKIETMLNAILDRYCEYYSDKYV